MNSYWCHQSSVWKFLELVIRGKKVKELFLTWKTPNEPVHKTRNSSLSFELTCTLSPGSIILIMGAVLFVQSLIDTLEVGQSV